MVHLVYKALRDFPECEHSLWDTYRARRHGGLQLRTEGVQKLRWWQSVHLQVVHSHEGRSESYT